eukprot:jgi/Chlat1/2374/Chrsp17S02638
MAGAGAKKRVEANRRRLQLLLYAILGASALHAVLRLAVFGRTAGWFQYALFALACAAHWFCYSQLAIFAAPVYGSDGELVDGGADLSMGGMCEYYHDIIYITAFVQVASIFSGKFWLLWLVVPVYALYQLWIHVLQPYVFSKRAQMDDDDDPRAKKKREKAERKASRVKYSKGR